MMLLQQDHILNVLSCFPPTCALRYFVKTLFSRGVFKVGLGEEFTFIFHIFRKYLLNRCSTKTGITIGDF